MMKTLTFASFVAVAGAAFGEFVKPPEPKGVPELMVSSSGERITTREQWERVRRPEIVMTLLEREYGIRPVDRPADQRGDGPPGEQQVDPSRRAPVGSDCQASRASGQWALRALYRWA